MKIKIKNIKQWLMLITIFIIGLFGVLWLRYLLYSFLVETLGLNPNIIFLFLLK